MNKRMLLTALLATFVLFAWDAFSRFMTPLGSMGFSAGLKNEDAVAAFLRGNVDSGTYVIPTADTLAVAKERARAGPLAFLVIHRRGLDIPLARQVAVQFALDFAAMLIAAFLLAQLPAMSYALRLAFVTALGVLPCLRADIPLWNWYAFPRRYFAVRLVIDIAGFFIAGLVLARSDSARSETMIAPA